MLRDTRLKAARAALRAHQERKGTGRALTDKTRFDPAKNPDLESDFVDLVADVLHTVKAVGMDPKKITRMAQSHVTAEA